MQIRETKIPGCYELLPTIFKDERGSFVKTFHSDCFNSHRLEMHFAEEYYSVSYQNVFRGFHFQIPPKDHTKIVYCVRGQVRDAVVDLRVGSPTYCQFDTFDLTAEKANIIYIPPGLAHGFYVTCEIAVMMYKVSTVYSPEHDTGIHWKSVGISWQNVNPIVSKRDSSFIALSDFNSPFLYQK